MSQNSIDKATVVRPLVELPQSRRTTFCIGEAQIVWCDSLTEKVKEGLQTSRYVVVLLSTSFIQQSLARKTIYAALDLETVTGKSKVLALLVKTSNDNQWIRDHYPLISGVRLCAAKQHFVEAEFSAR